MISADLSVVVIIIQRLPSIGLGKPEFTSVESDGALRSGNAIADLNRNRSAV